MQIKPHLVRIAARNDQYTANVRTRLASVIGRAGPVPKIAGQDDDGQNGSVVVRELKRGGVHPLKLFDRTNTISHWGVKFLRVPW